MPDLLSFRTKEVWLGRVALEDLEDRAVPGVGAVQAAASAKVGGSLETLGHLGHREMPDHPGLPQPMVLL